MKQFLAILIFINISKLSAQESLLQLDLRELKTLEKKKFIPKSLTAAYTVFIFFAPDCPLSQKYTLTLHSIFEKFKGHVNFVGVFAGKWYSDLECKKFKKSYAVPYQLIKDEKLTLTNYLGASVTPEVFLVDSDNKILYHGAIDNWAVSLGRNRAGANQHYLSDAISQALKKQIVNPDFVKPIGCFIEK